MECEGGQEEVDPCKARLRLSRQDEAILFMRYIYARYRLGGVTLPGYCQEELKGGQALAGALSLRYRVAGQLRLVARGGAGNVFARTGDITGSGLRWGAGVGLYHPSPIGPVSFEFGVRKGGGTLTALSVGWN